MPAAGHFSTGNARHAPVQARQRDAPLIKLHGRRADVI
jgi:hypothetical protein